MRSTTQRSRVQLCYGVSVRRRYWRGERFGFARLGQLGSHPWDATIKLAGTTGYFPERPPALQFAAQDRVKSLSNRVSGP